MQSLWTKSQQAHLERLRRSLLSYPELWQKIAKEAGVSRRTIYGFVLREEAHQNPCVLTLMQVADALDNLLHPEESVVIPPGYERAGGTRPVPFPYKKKPRVFVTIKARKRGTWRKWVGVQVYRQEEEIK